MAPNGVFLKPVPAIGLRGHSILHAEYVLGFPSVSRIRHLAISVRYRGKIAMNVSE